MDLPCSPAQSPTLRAQGNNLVVLPSKHYARTLDDGVMLPEEAEDSSHAENEGTRLSTKAIIIISILITEEHQNKRIKLQ